MGYYRDKSGNVLPDTQTRARLQRQSDQRMAPILAEVVALASERRFATIVSRWSWDQRHRFLDIAERVGNRVAAAALTAARAHERAFEAATFTPET